MRKFRKFFTVIIISMIIFINYNFNYVFADTATAEGDVDVTTSNVSTISSHLIGIRVWPKAEKGEIYIHSDGNDCEDVDFRWNVNEVIIIVNTDSNGQPFKYKGKYYKCSVMHITGWPAGTNSTTEFTADEIAKHFENLTMHCEGGRIYQRWILINDVKDTNPSGKKENVDTDIDGVEKSPDVTNQATSGGVVTKKQNQGTKSLKDMIADATSFVNPEKDPDGNEPVNETTFQQGISELYNIFFAIGMAVAVITGMILGIRFITASVEGKAEIKELLTAYMVGCIVVFGAFGIWKLVLTILSTI